MEGEQYQVKLLVFIPQSVLMTQLNLRLCNMIIKISSSHNKLETIKDEQTNSYNFNIYNNNPCIDTRHDVILEEKCYSERHRSLFTEH